MAFKWITKYNSPNYTPASKVSATWGQPRTIKAIAIHWWGDPKQKPTLGGVVATLCNPARGASAHIVASGTNREAACLVDFANASWATNSANPYTISIECDPRCRPEDYDVIAEVIAQLRSIYGNLPLVPHRQFVATACPGNYDLKKLDKLAKTKSVSKNDKWGDVNDKKEDDDMITRRGLYYLVRANSRRSPSDAEYKKYVGKIKFDDMEKKVQAWGSAKNRRAEAAAGKFTTVAYMVGFLPYELRSVFKAPKAPESPSKDGFTESDRTLLQDIKKLVQSVSDGLKGIITKG